MTKASPKIQLLGAVFGAAVASHAVTASIFAVYLLWRFTWLGFCTPRLQGLIDAATS